jgi:hypothetical protein
LDDLGARRATPKLSSLQSSSLLLLVIRRGDRNDQDGERPEHQAEDNPAAAASTLSLRHKARDNRAAKPDQEEDRHLRSFAADAVTIAIEVLPVARVSTMNRRRTGRPSLGAIRKLAA